MAAGVFVMSTLLVGCMMAVIEGFSPLLLEYILLLIDSVVVVERSG